MIASLKDRFEMRTKDMEGQQIFYVRTKEYLLFLTGMFFQPQRITRSNR